jgi:hypothetical protein
MQVKRDDDSFTLTLTKLELGRLLVCGIESVESLSRAEFFIRTGWARDDVRDAIASMDGVLAGQMSEISIDVPQVQEEVENPRRPRGNRTKKTQEN